MLPVSLTGDGKDGNMPKEPDLQNIPLHKSAEDAAKVQSLVVEVSSGSWRDQWHHLLMQGRIEYNWERVYM